MRAINKRQLFGVTLSKSRMLEGRTMKAADLQHIIWATWPEQNPFLEIHGSRELLLEKNDGS